MSGWIWYAVAALMLLDAVAYLFGAIGSIRRAIAPADPYWQRRLLLNLMLAARACIWTRRCPWSAR